MAPWRVAQGEVLHRDFYANYGPAQFYILAGLFKVFGFSILVDRVWDTIVRAMIVTVAFLIVQRGGARREGFAAAGLVLVWLCFLGYYAYPVFPALLFALLAALCCCRFSKAVDRRYGCSAAGFVSALPSCFVMTSGFIP